MNQENKLLLQINLRLLYELLSIVGYGMYYVAQKIIVKMKINKYLS